MPDDNRIDLREQGLVDMADVLTDSAVVKGRLVGHGELRQAHDLAHEAVVVGDVLDAVVITIQAEAHHAQHQNVPQIHARPAGVPLLVSDHFLLKQFKDGLIDLRCAKDPLETR